MDGWRERKNEKRTGKERGRRQEGEQEAGREGTSPQVLSTIQKTIIQWGNIFSFQFMSKVSSFRVSSLDGMIFFFVFLGKRTLDP